MNDALADSECAPTSPPACDAHPLLEVEGLSKYFPIRAGFWGRVRRHVRAVDRVSLRIPAKTTYSLVGESGCGKTTTGRAILRLIEPSAGRVSFSGQDLSALSPEQMRLMRRRMQIIFQDPYSSLNPRQTVEAIITEPLQIHHIGTGADHHERLHELLRTVGLPIDCASRYPHEFSGGQRQRICIARALCLNPEFIVCDEAVSALDVSIQAQIINLLQQLQEERGITYLFISHNLSIVRHISHTVGVMYLGQLMEEAPVDTLFQEPLHPYTQALLSAVPQIDPQQRGKRTLLQGDVPSPENPPPGCPFHTRCPLARSECGREAIPEFHPAVGHRVRCLLYA